MITNIEKLESVLEPINEIALNPKENKKINLVPRSPHGPRLKCIIGKDEYGSVPILEDGKHKEMRNGRPIEVDNRMNYQQLYSYSEKTGREKGDKDVSDKKMKERMVSLAIYGRDFFLDFAEQNHPDIRDVKVVPTNKEQNDLTNYHQKLGEKYGYDEVANCVWALQVGKEDEYPWKYSQPLYPPQFKGRYFYIQ